MSNNTPELIQVGVTAKTDGSAEKLVSGLKKEYGSLERAIDSARKATERESKAINSVEKELNRLQRSKAIDSLVRELVDANGSARDLERALSDVGASSVEVGKAVRQFDRLKESADGAARAARSIDFDEVNNRARRSVGAVGDVDTAAQTIGGAAQAAGLEGVGGGLRAAGEVAAVTEGVVQLGAALPAVATALGTSVVALGVFGVAIAAVGTAVAIAAGELAKGRKAFEQSVENIKEFNVAVNTINTEQAQQKLTQLEGELAGVSQTLEQVRSAGENATGPIGALVKQFGGVNEAVKALEAEQVGLQQSVDLYTQGLQENAFAQNDVTQATDDSTAAIEAFQEAQRQLSDSIVEANRQAKLFIETAQSADQIEDRIEALEREKASLEEASQAYGVSQEQQRRYLDQVKQIEAELETLNIAGKERIETLRQEEAVANAANRARQAFEEGKKALEQFAKAAEAAREKEFSEAEKTAGNIVKIQQDIIQIRERSAERIKKIEADLANDEANAAKERQTALTDLAFETNAARKEAQAEADAALLQLSKDTANRRAEIEREATRSLEQASQERNAVAFDAARTRREDELNALNTENEQRRAEIKQQLEQQTTQIRENLKRQTQLINRSYEQQLQSAQTAARAAIQTEQAKAQAEIQTRKQALSIELQALNTLSSAAQAFAQNLIATANRLGTSVQNAQRIRPTQPATAERPGSGGGGRVIADAVRGGQNFLRRVFSADAGAIVQTPGLMQVTSGEAVLRPRQFRNLQTAAASNNVNMPLTINVNGMNNRREIQREVMRQVDTALDEVFGEIG